MLKLYSHRESVQRTLEQQPPAIREQVSAPPLRRLEQYMEHVPSNASSKVGRWRASDRLALELTLDRAGEQHMALMLQHQMQTEVQLQQLSELVSSTASMPDTLPATEQAPAVEDTIIAELLAEPAATAPATQPATSNERATRQAPSITPITEPEFNACPRSLRGRLTVDKLNAAIAEINQLLAKKHRDREARTRVSFSDSELRSTTHLRPDASGKATLALLKHLKRVQPLAGGGGGFTIASKATKPPTR